jgi:hypothetical protein
MPAWWETGTADRPRASREVLQQTYEFGRSSEILACPMEGPRERIPDSSTQGEGKSPGMRWPWTQFFRSKALTPYANYRAHWQHELPSRILIAAERGPLDRNYLDYYEQAPRHTWPGGGVIEYPASSPLVNYARRLGEQPQGVAI